MQSLGLPMGIWTRWSLQGVSFKLSFWLQNLYWLPWALSYLIKTVGWGSRYKNLHTVIQMLAAIYQESFPRIVRATYAPWTPWTPSVSPWCSLIYVASCVSRAFSFLEYRDDVKNSHCSTTIVNAAYILWSSFTKLRCTSPHFPPIDPIARHAFPQILYS